MQFDGQNPYGQRVDDQPQGKGNSVLWFMLAGVGGVFVLCCGGVMAALMYVGVQSPETSVYTGNRVPQRFVDVAREVGALDEGESIRFFYSDALLDVREGFYFVSDRKVVIYVADGREQPLEIIPFDQIIAVDIHRDESFMMDSEITIETDEAFYSFPVSSEFDRDRDVYHEIEKHIPPPAADVSTLDAEP